VEAEEVNARGIQSSEEKERKIPRTLKLNCAKNR
jgi:hypothetical protein